MQPVQYYTLRNANNLVIPMHGFGTWRITDSITHPNNVNIAITAAISNKYRLIDTAEGYGNESSISTALQLCYEKFKLSRSDLFITSKCSPKNHGFDSAKTAYHNSVIRLNCQYLDLYLIHWPGTQGLKHDDPSNKSYRKKSWLALEELYKDGHVKSIGVSNYTVKHLIEMKEFATILPAVNQVEYHPYLILDELRNYCTQNDILLQSYSTLGCGKLLDDPTLVSIATRLEKNVSQVILRWALQKGVAVIPRSVNPDHIADNSKLFDFELDQSDMDIIGGLDKRQRFCWDPSDVA